MLQCGVVRHRWVLKGAAVPRALEYVCASSTAFLGWVVQVWCISLPWQNCLRGSGMVCTRCVLSIGAKSLTLICVDEKESPSEGDRCCHTWLVCFLCKLFGEQCLHGKLWWLRYGGFQNSSCSAQAFLETFHKGCFRHSDAVRSILIIQVENLIAFVLRSCCLKPLVVESVNLKSTYAVVSGVEHLENVRLSVVRKQINCWELQDQLIKIIKRPLVSFKA